MSLKKNGDAFRVGEDAHHELTIAGTLFEVRFERGFAPVVDNFAKCVAEASAC